MSLSKNWGTKAGMGMAATVLGILAAAGCSREMGGPAKVTFLTSSGVGSLSLPTGQINHIAINVRGEGIPGGVMTYSWDGHNEGAVPPSEIVLQIPSGPSRLIQYLGVFSDKTNTTQPYTFTYDSKTLDLQPGAQVVDLFPVQVNTSGGRQGNVGGQYMMFDGSISMAGAGVFGPTARFRMEIEPVVTDPPMVVGYAEMFNGWIKMFTIQGINFTYRNLDSGITLASVNYNALAASTSTRLMHARIPTQVFRYDSGNNSFREDDGGDMFLGFFGPYSTLGGSAAYPSSAISIPDLFFKSGAVTIPVNWNTTNQGEVVSGGTTSYSGAPYVNYLYFDPLALRNGIHGIGGFDGPFRSGGLSISGPGCSSGGSNDASVAVCLGDFDAGGTNNDLKMVWNFLPGVTISNANVKGIEGVTPFVVSCNSCGANDCFELYKEQNGDGIRCSEMGSFPGVIKYPDVSALSGAMTVATHYNQSLSGSGYAVFLCAYRTRADGTRQYFTSAGRGWFGGGGGPMGSITIMGIMELTNSNADNYFVDSNPSAGPIANFTSVAGAFSYTFEVRDSGDTNVLCGPIMGTPPTISLGTCASLNSEIQYSARVRAYDGSGNTMSDGSMPFYRVINEPTLSAPSYDCSTTWNAGSNVSMIANITAGNATMIDWLVTPNGLGSNSSPYSVSAAITLNTGMIPGTSYSPVQSQFTLTHTTGYQKMFQYDTSYGSGVCP